MSQPLFERIERAIVAVEDIERAKQDFAAWFAMEFHPTHTDHEARVRVTHSKTGPGFELVSPLDPAGRNVPSRGRAESWPDEPDQSFARRQLDAQGEGLVAVLIEVSDLDQASQHVEALGWVRAHEFRRGRMREILYSSENTYGVSFLLMEVPRDSTLGAEVDQHYRAGLTAEEAS